uniref:Minor histocompatibility antigen H13 n=2 Tax=Noctiluca scintillans TaxID=2966 RepID=A0A7S0ZPL8_NOCSC|mmetsp:Transcript_12871/g.35553  ORF Transcript_12871/g.35553 Transcript_12871/m.35553 type:complete len:204 (+) Transcript_12871:156-767(+)
MAGGFLVTKHWIINNIFGVSFCLLGIKMIGIASYRTGAIMLIGLFFYDIFWVFGSKSVFGSNVMVTVAKGVEAPIKLMFPRFLHGCGTLQHSMLGLGDIVVPGIFIAFLAKWDAIKMGEQKSTSFVYLNVTMVAYILSLVTTVGIMLFFNHAQPALLYIVPFVLFASFSVAVVRGEVKAILSFDLPEEPIKEVTSESAEKKES